MVNDNQELIGDYLKNHREKIDVTIKIIANDTKINITQLELLESNNFEKLPNIAYVRGFVKNYAKTLGLNIDHCLEILEASYYPVKPDDNNNGEKQKSTSQNSHKHTNKNQESSKNNNINKPPILIIAAGAFVFLLIIVLSTSSKKDSEIEAPPIVKVIKPQTLNLKTKLLRPQENNEQTTLEKEITQASQSIQPTSTITKLKEVTKQESTKKEATKQKPITDLPEKQLTSIIPSPLGIAAQKVQIQPKVAANNEVIKKIEETTNTQVTKIDKTIEKVQNIEKVSPHKFTLKKEVNFSKLPSPLFTIDNTMTKEDIDLLLPVNIKNSNLSERQNVYINSAYGDTWITFKVDQNPIKKYILKKGRTLFLKGQMVRIFLGNVHVTKVFYNNQPLKIVSKSGVKSLVFPVVKSDDFVLPLFVYPKSGRVITSQDYLLYLKNN